MDHRTSCNSWVPLHTKMTGWTHTTAANKYCLIAQSIRYAYSSDMYKQNTVVARCLAKCICSHAQALPAHVHVYVMLAIFVLKWHFLCMCSTLPTEVCTHKPHLPKKGQAYRYYTKSPTAQDTLPGNGSMYISYMALFKYVFNEQSNCTPRCP